MTSGIGILLVDDEPDFVRGMQRLLMQHFPEEHIETAFSGPEALEKLRGNSFGLVLTDLNMPGMDGLELVRAILEEWPRTSLVMLTAYGTVQTAVQALKNGAYDFLTKPVEPEELFTTVGRGLERGQLLRENDRLRELLHHKEEAGNLIGESAPMRRLKEAIAAVADSDYTVLVRGESGTGKELVARTIHRLSPRAAQALVTVNCPAIPNQLLESELFGHVKGAFTGADRDRKGLFVNARGGTLLLDEIGDIPQELQTKLLRCLQEGEIRPVGSSRTERVDVRIIASTNQDLEAKIRDKSFREDLYYRLNVLSLSVPPLRDRTEDIPLLARHFLAMACAETDRACKDVTPQALAYLAGRNWPGNVRELQNFVRRLTVFSPRETIDLSHVRLAESQALPRFGEDSPGPYKEAKGKIMDDFTRAYVRDLLESTAGNISEAARVSGLSRVALQKILKRLDMDAEGFRS
ncbi:MAG: sigma-54 dependent transcriptional regulator [Desulfovibrionaceae bacterium]